MDSRCFLRAYSDYMGDLNDSQGFYVTPGRDGSVLPAGVRRVDDQSDELYQRGERAARFSVQNYNKSVESYSKLLNFQRIVTLNFQPSVVGIYYITMKVDSESGSRYYHAKVWEKLNSGYKVYSFSPAPYCAQLHDDLTENNNTCCVGVALEPWMDENYLYYKIFRRIEREIGIDIVALEVGRNERIECLGYLWCLPYDKGEELVEKYNGTRMPYSDRPLHMILT